MPTASNPRACQVCGDDPGRPKVCSLACYYKKYETYYTHKLEPSSNEEEIL